MSKKNQNESVEPKIGPKKHKHDPRTSQKRPQEEPKTTKKAIPNDKTTRELNQDDFKTVLDPQRAD